MLIYNHLLVPQPGEGVLIFHNDFTRPRESLGISASIIRTNKQVHAEASPILYRKNIFRIDLSWKRQRLWYLRPGGSQIWNETFSAYQDASCTPRSAVISAETLRRMRHIEIVARHELIQSNLLCGSDGVLQKDLLIDILRILAEEERVTIGVNKIIVGEDVKHSSSLTIYLGGYGNFIALWSNLMAQSLPSGLEARMRRMRQCMKRVEERRHLELFESRQPEDEHEHAEYRPTDMDAVFMTHV